MTLFLYGILLFLFRIQSIEACMATVPSTTTVAPGTVATTTTTLATTVTTSTKAPVACATCATPVNSDGSDTVTDGIQQIKATVTIIAADANGCSRLMVTCTAAEADLPAFIQYNELGGAALPTNGEATDTLTCNGMGYVTDLSPDPVESIQCFVAVPVTEAPTTVPPAKNCMTCKISDIIVNQPNAGLMPSATFMYELGMMVETAPDANGCLQAQFSCTAPDFGDDAAWLPVISFNMETQTLDAILDDPNPTRTTSFYCTADGVWFHRSEIAGVPDGMVTDVTCAELKQ